jgi:flagellar biosynthesis protein FlhG
MNVQMAKIYSIGGGKGGVGKSFITGNLGVVFAKQGKKVILVDLDLGGSNLHTFLGIQNPETSLHDFLTKKIDNLSQAATPTGIPGLSIICSMNCSLEIANLFHAQKQKIIRAIQKLPYDYILLDLGAGTNFNTLDFFLTSNEGLFIFTPEPTSIETTLRFIKAVFYRRLKQILKERPFHPMLNEFTEKFGDSTISLSNILDFVAEHDQDRGQLLYEKLREYTFRFILNEFRKHTNPKLGENIEKVCNRHFYSKFQFLGSVSYDERVHDSVYSRKIYVNKYPYTPTATEIQQIGRKMTEDHLGIDIIWQQLP